MAPCNTKYKFQSSFGPLIRLCTKLFDIYGPPVTIFSLPALQKLLKIVLSCDSVQFLRKNIEDSLGKSTWPHGRSSIHQNEVASRFSSCRMVKRHIWARCGKRIQRRIPLLPRPTPRLYSQKLARHLKICLLPPYPPTI